MESNQSEEDQLRSVALQNAGSILAARQRAEQALLKANESLELKSGELAHSLAMMQATLESTTDAILVTDEQRRVTAFNQKYLELWRIPPEILDTRSHQTLLEAIASEFKEPRAFLARIQEIYETAPTESFDVLELADGRVFERSSKLQRVGERNVGRVWSLRDITQRRRDEAVSARLAAIVESSEDAIISKTLEGIVTTWNGGAERLFGYTAGEMIGQPIAILIPPNRLNEEPSILERIKRGLRVEHYETIRMRKNGTFLNISLTISPIKNAAGKIIGASKIARDITEKKQAEESLRQQREWFQVTFSSIGDAVITTDVEGKVTFLNPVAEKLTGWKTAEAAGLPLANVFNIVNEDTRERAENPVETALREGKIVALENHTALISKAGLETAIEDSAAPIKDLAGKTIGCIMVFHDVTDRRRAEETLRQREQFNRAIIESSRDCIQTLSPDGALLWMSERGRELCLGNINTLIGKSWIEFWSEEDRVAARAAVQAAAQGGTGNFVGRFSVPAETKWWEVVVTPILDAAGKPVELLAVSRDITARKEAEESLRRSEEELRVMADSISQLVWMAEPDGHIFWYNRRWYDYTGTTLEQMSGWGWQSVHDPKILPQVLERWRESIRTGQPFEMEFPLRGADGAFRWFLTRVNPVRDTAGHVIRWFGTNTDVEEVKRAEEHLAAARDSAEQANQAKDHFLAALSHELRTPLTPVLALLSSFTEDAAIPKDIADNLEIIRRNVELEVRLIDDLLDLTRIKRSKFGLHFHRTNLQQVIEDAINTCLPDLKTKRLSLVREIIPPSRAVLADSTRLTQILWNLLKNSIKFTPEGGEITIRCQSNSEGGAERIVIQVQDTGRGIEPGQLNLIFGAFEQGDPKITRQFGGLGLGLAISRAIAEAHGGTLNAVSEGPGRGSIFTLVLPVKVEPEAEKYISPARNLPAAPPPKDSEIARPPFHILLVEDHTDTANSLSRLLQRRGFLVTTANNVGRALNLFASEPFDLVVSDLGLPDASGYELMRKVRAIREIPGIALSGFGMEEDIARCHAAGFSEHLVKPIRLPQLEEAIQRAMARS